MSSNIKNAENTQLARQIANRLSRALLSTSPIKTRCRESARWQVKIAFQTPQQLSTNLLFPIIFAEKLYGDWKSMDIVFSDVKQRPNPVGR